MVVWVLVAARKEEMTTAMVAEAMIVVVKNIVKNIEIKDFLLESYAKQALAIMMLECCNIKKLLVLFSRNFFILVFWGVIVQMWVALNCTSCIVVTHLHFMT